MHMLDDLLISKIRKTLLKCMKEDGFEDPEKHIWATQDKNKTWVVTCNACLMLWPIELVDPTSTKLDNLITEGFLQRFAEHFDEDDATAVMMPELNRVIGHVAEVPIAPEEKSAFDKYDVVVFEYNKGWSRTISKARVYYKAAYLALAKELISDISMHYKIYNAGDYGDGMERQWLVVYEGKTPFMFVANCIPRNEDGKEDAHPAG